MCPRAKRKTDAQFSQSMMEVEARCVKRKRDNSKFQERPSFSKIGFSEPTVRRFINLGRLRKNPGIKSVELGRDRDPRE